MGEGAGESGDNLCNGGGAGTRYQQVQWNEPTVPRTDDRGVEYRVHEQGGRGGLSESCV